MTLASKINVDPSPSTSSRAVISPSLERVVLTIIPPSSGSVTLSNGTVTADGAGLYLTAGQAPVSFHVDIHGDVVRQGWYAKYTAGATGISWVEGIA